MTLQSTRNEIKMNGRSVLSNILFKATLIVGGGLLGLVAGIFVYEFFLPPWKTLEIQSTYTNGVDILFVDFYRTDDDPADDVLYIRTQLGDIYSVSNNQWLLIPSLPGENAILEIKRRDGYADSPIVAITPDNKVFQLIDNKWEALEDPKEPFWGVEPKQCSNWRKRLSFRKIIDSSGVSFAHALADSEKCYVLFDDGDLEVWTRTQDAFTLMGTLGISVLIGIVAVNTISLRMKQSRTTLG